MNIRNEVLSIFEREGKSEYFFSHLLIPLWLLTFYLLYFSKYLPAGINNAFVTNSGKNLLRVAEILSILFLLLILFKKDKFSLFRKRTDKITPDYLILLLLPLTPLVQYILYNLETLSTSDIIYIIFVFTLATAFFAFFLPLALNKIASAQVMILLGIALSFSLINMGALSKKFSWHEVGNLKIQVLVFTGVFGILWLFFSLKKKRWLYTLIMLLFFSTLITPVLTGKAQKSSQVSFQDKNSLYLLSHSRQLKSTPNIYLLVYDAYVGNETMLAYGIDNKPQEEYLENLGFQLYSGTYSIGTPSVSSMSRVLNASPEFYGNSRRAVSGDGVVQNLLKESGYEAYGLFTSNHFFQGATSHYDYTYPKYETPPKDLLIKAILVGEFRFDLGMPTKVLRNRFLNEKHNLLATERKRPNFVYMHTDVPNHSQNSGACLPNEVELFNERLQKANVEMKDDLAVILKNDPNAIIIVAGDHGPYLTKNCMYTEDNYDISEITRLDIQDRFGTFLAIRWPTEDFEQYDEITVLQDIFPAVFAYLFQDTNILEAKVEPVTVQNNAISGAMVIDGIIVGGINDGEPLFIGTDH